MNDDPVSFFYSVLQMPLSPEEKKNRKADKKAQKLREAEEMRIKLRKVKIILN